MAHRVKNVRRLVLGMSEVVVWPVGPIGYTYEVLLSLKAWFPDLKRCFGAEGHMSSFTPLRIKLKVSTLTSELTVHSKSLASDYKPFSPNPNPTSCVCVPRNTTLT